MPRLAALHLCFQAPFGGGIGASGVLGYSQRMVAHPRFVDFLPLARRWPFPATSRARRNPDKKVSLIGAAPEGADSLARDSSWPTQRGLSVSRRDRFACRFWSARAPLAAKTQYCSSPPPAACRSARSAVLQRPWPNPSFQGTAGKQRLPVPSALRAPAAPELKRWAAQGASLLC